MDINRIFLYSSAFNISAMVHQHNYGSINIDDPVHTNAIYTIGLNRSKWWYNNGRSIIIWCKIYESRTGKYTLVPWVRSWINIYHCFYQDNISTKFKCWSHFKYSEITQGCDPIIKKLSLSKKPFLITDNDFGTM